VIICTFLWAIGIISLFNYGVVCPVEAKKKPIFGLQVNDPLVF
jgi:hypothetical protein